MVNYELKPTVDNIRLTLLKNSTGRNEGLAHFIELLDGIEGNNVIALDDKWGNGKTFFVKQLQLLLQNWSLSTEEAADIQDCVQVYLQGHKIRNYIPIYYDAWSNDSDDDPVLSIIYNMIQEINDLHDYEVTDKDWTKTAITALEIITTAFSGIRIKDFLETVKGVNPLTTIKRGKKTDQIINDLFDIILKKHADDTRIIFLVDELDRCRPDFAVKVLERIKHYFLHDKVIFVLSVNTAELQHTIKQHYGSEFDAIRYLTRFFNLTVSLPSPNTDTYYQTLDFLGHVRTRDYVAKAVISIYGFSLRDITRYLQMLRITIPMQYNEDRRELGFYMEILIPFMLGLRIHDTSKYDKFIHGFDSSPFIEFVITADVNMYCHILKDSSETFLPNESEQKTLVSVEERFDSLYNCIFGVKVRNNRIPEEVTIAGTTFSSQSKQIIMGVVSCMMVKQNL